MMDESDLITPRARPTLARRIRLSAFVLFVSLPVLVPSAVIVFIALDPPPRIERSPWTQMRVDRPRLAAALDSQPEIHEWAAHEFAGQGSGLLFGWDPAAPISGFDAEHHPTEGGAVIRIREDLSGLDQMACLVFEMHNARGKERFEEVTTQALNGQLDREQFVRAMVEQETRAELATRRFLRETFRMPTSRGLDQHPHLAASLLSDATSEEIVDHALREGGYRQFYEDAYDRLPVPSRLSPPQLDGADEKH